MTHSAILRWLVLAYVQAIWTSAETSCLKIAECVVPDVLLNKHIDLSEHNGNVSLKDWIMNFLYSRQQTVCNMQNEQNVRHGAGCV
jgi:hypothetical protein